MREKFLTQTIPEKIIETEIKQKNQANLDKRKKP